MHRPGGGQPRQAASTMAARPAVMAC